MKGRRLSSSMLDRKVPQVPEPGQRVRLRTGRGRWRGSFRAISSPYTDEGLGVVVRVAEEREYRKAVREGHRAFGMPWPVYQIEPVPTPEGAEQETQELPQSQRPQRRSWWREFFGIGE